MRAPLLLDVYLGCAKPTPAEVALERVIGCGRRPLFCYKTGPKWAHVLYISTLTPVRVRVNHLWPLMVAGSATPVGPRIARALLRRIRERLEFFKFEEWPRVFSTTVVEREAMDVLEKIIEKAKEPRGEGAADPEISQARDARPDAVHSQGEA